jgi:hypothetical protein
MLAFLPLHPSVTKPGSIRLAPRARHRRLDNRQRVRQRLVPRHVAWRNTHDELLEVSPHLCFQSSDLRLELLHIVLRRARLARHALPSACWRGAVERLVDALDDRVGRRIKSLVLLLVPLLLGRHTSGACAEHTLMVVLVKEHTRLLLLRMLRRGGAIMPLI